MKRKLTTSATKKQQIVAKNDKKNSKIKLDIAVDTLESDFQEALSNLANYIDFSDFIDWNRVIENIRKKCLVNPYWPFGKTLPENLKFKLVTQTHYLRLDNFYLGSIYCLEGTPLHFFLSTKYTNKIDLVFIDKFNPSDYSFLNGTIIKIDKVETLLDTIVSSKFTSDYLSSYVPKLKYCTPKQLVQTLKPLEELYSYCHLDLGLDNTKPNSFMTCQIKSHSENDNWNGVIICLDVTMILMNFWINECDFSLFRSLSQTCKLFRKILLPYFLFANVALDSSFVTSHSIIPPTQNSNDSLQKITNFGNHSGTRLTASQRNSLCFTQLRTQAVNMCAHSSLKNVVILEPSHIKTHFHSIDLKLIPTSNLKSDLVINSLRISIIKLHFEPIHSTEQFFQINTQNNKHDAPILKMKCNQLFIKTQTLKQMDAPYTGLHLWCFGKNFEINTELQALNIIDYQQKRFSKLSQHISRLFPNLTLLSLTFSLPNILDLSSLTNLKSIFLDFKTKGCNDKVKVDVNDELFMIDSGYYDVPGIGDNQNLASKVILPANGLVSFSTMGCVIQNDNFENLEHLSIDLVAYTSFSQISKILSKNHKLKTFSYQSKRAIEYKPFYCFGDSKTDRNYSLSTVLKTSPTSKSDIDESPFDSEPLIIPANLYGSCKINLVLDEIFPSNVNSFFDKLKQGVLLQLSDSLKETIIKQHIHLQFLTHEELIYLLMETDFKISSFCPVQNLRNAGHVFNHHVFLKFLDGLSTCGFDNIEQIHNLLIFFSDQHGYASQIMFGVLDNIGHSKEGSKRKHDLHQITALILGFSKFCDCDNRMFYSQCQLDSVYMFFKMVQILGIITPDSVIFHDKAVKSFWIRHQCAFEFLNRNSKSLASNASQSTTMSTPHYLIQHILWPSSFDYNRSSCPKINENIVSVVKFVLLTRDTSILESINLDNIDDALWCLLFWMCFYVFDPRSDLSFFSECAKKLQSQQHKITSVNKRYFQDVFSALLWTKKLPKKIVDFCLEFLEIYNLK